MTTAVRPDESDWWWVECDCGYRQGPFVAQTDAMDDGEEHADDCTPENVETSSGCGHSRGELRADQECEIDRKENVETSNE